MIALVPLPPHRRYGRPLPLLAVSDGPRVLGQIAEVADFVWWFRLPGSPYFAPAAGPSQRDAVAALLRLRDRGPGTGNPLGAVWCPPPRRNIPTSDQLLRACRESGKENADADAP